MRHIFFSVFLLGLGGGAVLGLYVLIRRALGLFSLKHERLLSLLGSLGILALVVALDGLLGVGTLAILFLLLFSLGASLVRWGIHVLFPGKSRRSWRYLYRLSLIPLLCTALLLGYGYRNMTNPVRTSYTVTTEKDIPREGYRVALLSDLHYGSILEADTLQEVCREISQAQVDLVILCGDVVDESTGLSQLRQVFSILGDIESRYGIYYVYGNHDRATYTDSPGFTQEELTGAITENGIQILRDEAVEIGTGLVLIGREDRSAPARLSLEQLTEQVDGSRFLLLADHQPRELAEKARAGIDLQVSGHTHGGQIFPLGYISLFLGLNEMNYGLRSIDGMTAIVTSGLAGWGFPIRTQARSEYVIVEILPR